MSTEVAPETVLRAFIRTYPDLLPKEDLSHLGLIPDHTFGWPIGFSRSQPPHLGGLPSVGLNCAVCHVGEVVAAPGGQPVRMFGMTSHFDAEAFFGALIVSGFRTADPANFRRFLGEYLAASDPARAEAAQALLRSEWQRQEEKILAILSADPAASKGLAPGQLHELSAAELRLNRQSLAGGQDLSALAGSLLKLFHNMRAALHVPDQPPAQAPPASGPGRNDAFGLLSLTLFGQPQPYAPVKYGLVWNVAQRYWVHWDGNTRSPIGRNLLASLGLGAPLIGKRGCLDFALVQRQTAVSEKLRPPQDPWVIERAVAGRGRGHYQARCATCHDGVESDQRLHAPSEVGTEPRRAIDFSPLQAQRFDTFLAELEIPGYTPPKEPGIRSTQRYWAPSLAGVWARSPYLHNGSVRTMQELLSPAAARARSFRRGSRVYDTAKVGYTDEGVYVLDTTAVGSSNAGHEYGADLSNAEKVELIEYLKTL